MSAVALRKDPVRIAWAAINPRVPFPAHVLGELVPVPIIPFVPKSSAALGPTKRRAAQLVADPAVLDANHFWSPKACAHGHHVRYRTNGRCVACNRAAANTRNHRPTSSAESAREVRPREARVQLPGGTPSSPTTTAGV